MTPLPCLMSRTKRPFICGPVWLPWPGFLCLWGRNRSSTASIQALACGCPQLQHLHLKLGTGLQDEALETVLRSCRRLAFLNISCHFSLSREALLEGGCCPALRTLVCDRTCLDNEPAEGVLVRLVERFPNLECIFGPYDSQLEGSHAAVARPAWAWAHGQSVDVAFVGAPQ